MRPDFPLPDRDWPLTAGFWAAAEEHQLAIPRCAACRQWVWYPQESCPFCGGSALPWTPTSGRGELYSWSIVHHAFLPAFAALVPYVVGLVALVESPLVRVAAPISADPEALRAGLALTVGFETRRFAGVDGAVTAPFFAPA
jgi:uncharacterized protein